ncbi:MAG: hypothetical protein QNL60_07490 [Flavobacteriales bacterium]|jgi:hypothetical protein
MWRNWIAFVPTEYLNPKCGNAETLQFLSKGDLDAVNKLGEFPMKEIFGELNGDSNPPIGAELMGKVKLKSKVSIIPPVLCSNLIVSDGIS